MKEAFDNVKGLLDELSFLLIESGVPQHQVRMPCGRQPEEIKLERYVEAFDWLHRLASSREYAAVQKAKLLRPQQIWDAYKAHGFKNMQEQVILEKAQENLRRLWRTNRPSFFGRIYREPEQDSTEENSERESVRPEETGTNEGDC